MTGIPAESGLKTSNLGKTYLANRLTKEGNTIESTLDHIYQGTSKQEKSDESSADNLPIIVGIKKTTRSTQKEKSNHEEMYEGI